MYPDKYLYTHEHEWLEVQGDIATIGITHHAQDQLGDIVYLELPEVGESFSQGDEFGSVESVKAVAEVFMPVSGEIVAINESLAESPEQVNRNPHEGGWLVKVKITVPSELKELMDSASYREFVAEETK